MASCRLPAAPRSCGFHGIELFAAYNATIDQFWLPFNNRRNDKWGGSFENRMRFSRIVMERIRKMAGEDFHHRARRQHGP